MGAIQRIQDIWHLSVEMIYADWQRISSVTFSTLKMQLWQERLYNLWLQALKGLSQLLDLRELKTMLSFLFDS